MGGSTVGPAQTLFSGEIAERASDRPNNEQDLLDQLVSSGLGIRVGPLGGSTVGPAQTLFSGESAALFAALVKAPVNTGRPAISGGAKVGKDTHLPERDMGA